jgi:hypothetical protein
VIITRVVIDLWACSIFLGLIAFTRMMGALLYASGALILVCLCIVIVQGFLPVA